MNPERNEIETLLSAKQVAERWGICTKTVRRMVDRGILRPIRLSARCIRFSAAEVAAALSRMSDTGSGPLAAGGTI